MRGCFTTWHTQSGLSYKHFYLTMWRALYQVYIQAIINDDTTVIGGGGHRVMIKIIIEVNDDNPDGHLQKL